MAFESRAVANYLLDLAKQSGDTLSPMRVIKLAYISHGWHLAIFDDILLDEFCEAWKFGPVVPNIYHEFKEFGNLPILRPAIQLDPFTRELVPFSLPSTPMADRSRALMGRVWGVYKKFSALQLSAMTHRDGTPWHKTWNELGGKDIQGTDIPNELIKTHYKSLANVANRG